MAIHPPKIFLVSSGLLIPKKDNSPLNRMNLYPNYGLVSLATVLKLQGYNSTVIHGDYNTPDHILSIIENIGFSDYKIPLLLSLPSFFSLKWAQIFCKELKKRFPLIKIIVGGKWVTRGNEAWLNKKLTGINNIISCDSEHIISKIVTPDICNELSSTTNAYDTIPLHLDYTTVYNFKKYQPSIEISRGCGRGCSFCLERNEKYHLWGTPENSMKSILRHQKAYNAKNLSPYFQTSCFQPTVSWCKRFHELYHNKKSFFNWRTQTRVDSLSQEKIKILANSGLKILDLGLESASIKQLNAMNKTQSPHSYLECASSLLENCRQNKILTKVNILLYPGETNETLDETFQWVLDRKDIINGLSVNPFYIYRHEKLDETIDSIRAHGATIGNPDSLDEFGYTYCNLSSEVNYIDACNFSLKIRKAVVSCRDFFDLKSFSYFDRNYKIDHFMKDISTMNREELPFHE